MFQPYVHLAFFFVLLVLVLTILSLPVSVLAFLHSIKKTKNKNKIVCSTFAFLVLTLFFLPPEFSQSSYFVPLASPLFLIHV